MKTFNYVLILCVLLFSCGKNSVDTPKKPKNLISESKMVDVLYDMTVVSAAKGIDKKLLENKGVKPEEFIYSKHNIDSLQFANSNAYYAYDIRVYQNIYAKVKERLQTDKKGFNKAIEIEKKKRDSINAALKKLDSVERRALKERARTNEKPDLLDKIDTSEKLKRQ